MSARAVTSDNPERTGTTLVFDDVDARAFFEALLCENMEGAGHPRFPARGAPRPPPDSAARRGGAAGARVDDFALRRSRSYTTVLIDAETGRRVDVLPGRTADVAEAWLRDHAGVRVVCRDGSGAYSEAVRRALPGAVQAGDRWHLWHGLAETVLKEVAAHSACWAGAVPPQRGNRAETTLERWQQVHDLLGKGTGLLECARRLDLSLNTVKRYARAEQPERLQRAPAVPALGYHHVTTARLAAQSGSTWSRYAPRRPLTVIIRPSPAANPRQLNRRVHQNHAPTTATPRRRRSRPAGSR